LDVPYLIINKMKAVKSQIDIRYDTNLGMQNDGRDPLWMNLDE